MEGVIFFVICMIIITWIIYKRQTRTKKLGRDNMPYSYQHYGDVLLATRLIDNDGNCFTIILTNNRPKDIEIIDMHLEIKTKNNRYTKIPLPDTIFNHNSSLIIPPGESGVSYIYFKEFFKIIQANHNAIGEIASVKAVVVENEESIFKTSIIKVDVKKKSMLS